VGVSPRSCPNCASHQKCRVFKLRQLGYSRVIKSNYECARAIFVPPPVFFCSTPCSVPRLIADRGATESIFSCVRNTREREKDRIQLKQIFIYLFHCATFFSVRQHTFDYHLWLPEVMTGKEIIQIWVGLTFSSTEISFANSTCHHCSSRAQKMASSSSIVNCPPSPFVSRIVSPIRCCFG